MTAHTCEAILQGGFITNPARCSNRSTVIENGKHLCGIHSIKTKARREAIIAARRSVKVMREQRTSKMNSWVQECAAFVEKVAEDNLHTSQAMKDYIAQARVLAARKP